MIHSVMASNRSSSSEANSFYHQQESPALQTAKQFSHLKIRTSLTEGVAAIWRSLSALSWFFILFLYIFFSSASAQTTCLPTSHWVYDYLDRLETRGLLPRLLGDTRPMTRLAIARELRPLLDRRATLSRAEREQLEYLLVELREEFAQLGVIETDKSTGWSRLVNHHWVDLWAPDMFYANGRDMLAFSLPLPEAAAPPLRFWINPVIGFDVLTADADTLAALERVNHLMRGFALRGTLGSHLGFYSDARDNQEWGTRRYPGSDNFTRERLGFVRGSGSGNQMDYDETVAGLVYSRNWLTLQIGKDRNRWGPGYAGQLLLSDWPTSYDQIKLEVTASHFRFTSLWAVLQHYQSGFFNGGHQEKYLAAHRIEFSPWWFLDIGLHEAIIYAGRKFELAYLNPLNFFRSAEHYLGDRDNAAMGLDLQLKALPKTKLYLELLLDDITSSKIGTGFYGNKHAFTAGGYHVDLFGFSGLELRGEYTRIRPYTYTHDSITNFQHYSTNLGHRLGPNSEDLFFQLDYRYNRPLLLRAIWERTRHGANPAGRNIGGSLFQSRNFLIDPEYVDFLGGDMQIATTLTLMARYEFIHSGFLSVWYRHGTAEWDDEVDGGYPGTRREWKLQIGLNE